MKMRSLKARPTDEARMMKPSNPAFPNAMLSNPLWRSRKGGLRRGPVGQVLRELPQPSTRLRQGSVIERVRTHCQLLVSKSTTYRWTVKSILAARRLRPPTYDCG